MKSVAVAVAAWLVSGANSAILLRYLLRGRTRRMRPAPTATRPLSNNCCSLSGSASFKPPRRSLARSRWSSPGSRLEASNATLIARSSSAVRLTTGCFDLRPSSRC